MYTFSLGKAHFCRTSYYGCWYGAIRYSRDLFLGLPAFNSLSFSVHRWILVSWNLYPWSDIYYYVKGIDRVKFFFFNWWFHRSTPQSNDEVRVDKDQFTNSWTTKATHIVNWTCQKLKSTQEATRQLYKELSLSGLVSSQSTKQSTKMKALSLTILVAAAFATSLLLPLVSYFMIQICSLNLLSNHLSYKWCPPTSWWSANS